MTVESGWVVPARYVLTDLHRRDPGVLPVVHGDDPTDGATVCGLPMRVTELWRPVERLPDDRVCRACAGVSVAVDVQEALL